MTRTVKSRLAFTLILAGVALLAWLTRIVPLQADLSSAARNHLPATVVSQLNTLQGPLHLTASLRDDPILRRKLRDAVALIQQVKADTTLTFVAPELTTSGAQAGASLTLAHADQRSTIYSLDAQSLLRGLLQLQGKPEQWLVFLRGHGERDIADQSAAGFSAFGALAAQQGFRSLSLDLNETAGIPDNTALLIIAGASHDPDDTELALLNGYLASGGSLLWLLEPGPTANWLTLAARLGIAVQPGTLVQDDARLRAMLGLRHPAQIAISSHAGHPALRGFDKSSVFTVATALDPLPESGWQAHRLLETSSSSWSELGPLQGPLAYNEDEGELRGPLTLAIAASREWENRQQRLVVVGDSSVASNEFLPLPGNAALMSRLLRWLTQPGALVDTTADTTLTTALDANDPRLLQLSSLILFGLPALCLLMAAWQAWRLRQH